MYTKDGDKVQRGASLVGHLAGMVSTQTPVKQGNGDKNVEKCKKNTWTPSRLKLVFKV